MGALSSESSEPKPQPRDPSRVCNDVINIYFRVFAPNYRNEKDISMYNCVVRTSKHLFGLRLTDSHNTHVSVRFQISVSITMSLARDIQNPFKPLRGQTQSEEWSGCF